PVRNAIAQPKELASDREGFARELLRRMLGGEKKDDPRWLKWLRSDEANRTFGAEELAVYDWFTDAEYEARRNECGQLPHECAMPAKRPSAGTIPSNPVAPPSFTLPDVLPAGLADAIVSGTYCNDSWLGLATASVDPAGRVQQLDLRRVPNANFCAKALETILRLSLATNTSIVSPRTSDDVLLVHESGAPLCLNEDPPADLIESGLRRPGGSVVAPKPIKRVEPEFPRSALQSMRPGSTAVIVMEAVISKSGCVRSIRPVLQTPMPEVNGAAVVAWSQWRFSPALLDGKPVDVLFNLTVNFKR
ncbi:MAG TPA: energy transducer TonB, partial [Thermoanaerobaculia bacterium]|nr:energy transducer TonB [Thermoanaerobaculia bacterium]